MSVDKKSANRRPLGLHGRLFSLCDSLVSKEFPNISDGIWWIRHFLACTFHFWKVCKNFCAWRIKKSDCGRFFRRFISKAQWGLTARRCGIRGAGATCWTWTCWSLTAWSVACCNMANEPEMSVSTSLVSWELWDTWDFRTWIRAWEKQPLPTQHPYLHTDFNFLILFSSPWLCCFTTEWHELYSMTSSNNYGLASCSILAQLSCRHQRLSPASKPASNSSNNDLNGLAVASQPLMCLWQFAWLLHGTRDGNQRLRQLFCFHGS